MTNIYFEKVLEQFKRKIYTIQIKNEDNNGKIKVGVVDITSLKKGEIIGIFKLNKKNPLESSRIHFAQIKRVSRSNGNPNSLDKWFHNDNDYVIRLKRLNELPHLLKIKLSNSKDRERRQSSKLKKNKKERNDLDNPTYD